MLLELMVGNWIPLWAAHPEQTAARIEAAVGRIEQEMALIPSLRDAVLTQQFMFRRAVRDDWSILLPKRQYSESEAQSRTAFTVYNCCFPWEHARALRILDLVGGSEMQCLHVLDTSLQIPGLDMQYLANLTNAAPGSNDVTNPAFGRMYPGFRGFGRGEFFAPLQAETAPQERVPWNWVTTTYPLNASFDQSDLQRIWQTRLRRELLLRMTLLRLKLAAYKKTHGEYPEQLSGHNFGMHAIDPYTGAEFGYRPEGFAASISVTDGITQTEETLTARQPLLWSAGPADVRHFAPLPESNTVTMQAQPDGQVLPVHGVGGSAPRPATSRFANTTALVFTLP